MGKKNIKKTLPYQLGKKGEELARQYLERLGWDIIFKNYRCKGGEIDLGAVDLEGILHLVEVKSGRGEEIGNRFFPSQFNRIEKCYYRLISQFPQLEGLPFQLDGAVVDWEKERVYLIPMITL